MVEDGDFGLRRVRGAQDWNVARMLRYEGLLARGEIAPRRITSFADGFDGAPNTMTYLLEYGDRAVGTTRSSVAGRETSAVLPSHAVFAREMASAFGPDATVVEASLTFVDPRGARDAQLALVRLFRAHMLHCAAENADALVVAVRASQMGFFRRRFDMEILSGAEAYPGMASPRVLMGMAWREGAPRLLRRIPELAASAEEEAEFARP